MLWRGLYSLASRAGPSARLSTLIFHRVLPEADPLFPEEVDAVRFDRICSWLREWFNVLPLAEAALRLGEGTLPTRALALTFDDGYADNRSVAAPILRRHGLPCTFFVSTGFIDGGCMWNDIVIEAIRATRLPSLELGHLHPGLGNFAMAGARERRQAIDRIIAVAKYLEPGRRQELVHAVAKAAEALPPTHLMMTSQQLRELRALGLEVGAHTVSHPILAGLADDEARREIVEGRRQLEDVLGERVGLFAYPNGKPGEDYSARSVALVREAGFDAAVSTVWGVSTSATDRFQLKRFTPWDRSRLRFGVRMLRNMGVG
ncbi:MAG: polysaccharide deacetylase family protein [Rubrivivax sp.]|nr:polysaccharide deacetylase family protein [Rubrivivax sp.]